jgi:guanylate kinase
LSKPEPTDLYDFDPPSLLLVISGTSGAGKDSVARALVARMTESGYPARFVITATSRPKRDNEVHGKDYLFVSKSEFERMIAQDELLEYAVVYDQYKGIPKQQAREAMDSGNDVVMRLDVQGASTIRSMVPQAILVFIATPSEKELTDRLRRRHTESPEQLRLRLQTARQEMARIKEFDYLVLNRNGQLKETIDTVMSIVIAEKHRTEPRRASL